MKTFDNQSTLVNKILNSSTESNWIKTALTLAMSRDIIDAANDAELLAEALSERLMLQLEESENNARKRGPDF